MIDSKKKGGAQTFSPPSPHIPAGMNRLLLCVMGNHLSSGIVYFQKFYGYFG